jgi:hypothetical protein
MLSAIDLFPSTRFLRMRGGPELKSRCGGIASIIAILILMAILILKLKEVFSYTTIFYTTHEGVNWDPPLTTVTTWQNDTENSPYMIAVASRILECSSFSQQIIARYCHGYQLRTANQSYNCTDIILEPCTPEHFSIVPDIQNIFTNLLLDNMFCLPINTHFQLKGNT